MVTEFETLETLKSIKEDLKSFKDVQFSGAAGKLDTLITKYQTICDEYDKWADNEAKIQQEIDEGQLILESDFLEKQWQN